MSFTNQQFRPKPIIKLKNRGPKQRAEMKSNGSWVVCMIATLLAAGVLVHSFGSTTFTLGQQYVGKDAARGLLINEPWERSAHLDEREDAQVAYDRHHDRRVD